MYVKTYIFIHYLTSINYIILSYSIHIIINVNLSSLYYKRIFYISIEISCIILPISLYS